VTQFNNIYSCSPATRAHIAGDTFPLGYFAYYILTAVCLFYLNSKKLLEACEVSNVLAYDISNNVSHFNRDIAECICQ
jgi:hypothetical protein